MSEAMKTVYLCGGINGLNDSDCIDWRTSAKTLLSAQTIDPMRRDYRGAEAGNVDSIVLGDLEDIEACACVLVNATKPSWGTAMEVVYAFKARKKIYAFTGQARISPWLKFHCGQIFLTLEECCETMNRESL